MNFSYLTTIIKSPKVVNPMTVQTVAAIGTMLVLSSLGNQLSDIRTPQTNTNEITYIIPTRPPIPTSIRYQYPYPGITLHPTFTPTNKPSASPTTKPTAIITTTPTIKPTISINPTTSITSSPTAPASNDTKTYIMNEINKYRQSQGLAMVQNDNYTCSFAQIRAQEISTSFTHDGFTQRINNHSLPYPSYSLITENIAQNSDYRNVVLTWINSPGHAENMRRDTPYVCVEKYGNYYAYEGWKP